MNGRVEPGSAGCPAMRKGRGGGLRPEGTAAAKFAKRLVVVSEPVAQHRRRCVRRAAARRRPIEAGVLEYFTGRPTALYRAPPVASSSTSMPRCSTCGSANTSPSELIGPAGTPAAFSTPTHSSRGFVFRTAAMAATHASRCCTRSGFVRNLSSRERSGCPIAAQNRTQVRIVADGDDERLVGRFEPLVRNDRLVRGAPSPRFAAGHQERRGDVDERRDLRFEQRQVHALAGAGALTGEERRADGALRGEPRAHVGDRHAHLHRRSRRARP